MKMKMFRDALNGFYYSFKNERNIQIHVLFSIFVLSFLVITGAGAFQMVLAYLAIFSVISTELMNTALERLCDFVEPEFNQEIKIIKDISASSVLLNVIFALVMGYVIWKW